MNEELERIKKDTREWATTALFYVGLSYGKTKTKLLPGSEIGKGIRFRWYYSSGCPRAAIEQNGNEHWLSGYVIGGYDPFLLNIFTRHHSPMEGDTITVVEAVIREYFPGIEVWKCAGCNNRFWLEKIGNILLCRDCTKVLSPNNNDKYGFVYVFGSEETGYYKIGCSVHPNSRLLDYQQTKLPFPVEMIHTFPADNQYAAEKILHDVLGQQRSNGEWFKLSEDELHKITAIKGYQSGNLITS